MNKIEKLNSFRDSLNKMVERKIDEVKLNESIDNIQTIPIMSCRDAFMHTLPKLYESKEGKEFIKKYFNVMKENKQLARVFVVLESLRNSQRQLTDIDLAISEYRKLCESIDKRVLRKSLKEYRDIVSEAVRFTNLTNEEINDSIEKNRTINEALDYILLNETTINNIPEYTQHYSIVKENLEKSNKEIEDRKKMTLISANANIDENFEQLQNVAKDIRLESWEKEAFDKVVESRLSGKMEDAFNECRNECITLINETIEKDNENESLVSKMNMMKEQLDKKTYSEETFVTDILKLKELKNTLKD